MRSSRGSWLGKAVLLVVVLAGFFFLLSAIALPLRASHEMQNAPASRPEAQTSHFAWPGTRAVTVDDPSENMTAFTLEVPANWKYAGVMDVSARGTCHAGGSMVKLTAVSPDGQYGIFQLPGVTWKTSSSFRNQRNMARNGCPPVDIEMAADFIVNVLVPEIDPGAKIVEVLEPNPGLISAMEQRYDADSQVNRMTTNATGIPSPRLNLDGAHVRVQYSLDGKPEEELIGGFVECSILQMPDRSISRVCSSSGLFIVRAPQGHLDEFMAMPEFTAMMKTQQPNPEWAKRRQYEAQMQEQRFINRIRASQAISQQMLAASNAAFQAQMQSNQMFYNQLAENNAQFNANMQAGTNASMAAARQRMAQMDADAQRFTHYAGQSAAQPMTPGGGTFSPLHP